MSGKAKLKKGELRIPDRTAKTRAEGEQWIIAESRGVSSSTKRTVLVKTKSHHYGDQLDTGKKHSN